MASVAALRSNVNFKSAFSTSQNKKLNLRLINGGVASRYNSMNRFLIGNTDVVVNLVGIEKIKSESLNNKVSNVFNIRKNIFDRMEKREEENARERIATVSNVEKVQIESESESDSSSIFSVILTSLLTAVKKILKPIKKIFGYLKNVLPLLRKSLPALRFLLKRFPLIAGIGAVGALVDFLTKKETPEMPESPPATPPTPTPSTPSQTPLQPSAEMTPSTPSVVPPSTSKPSATPTAQIPNAPTTVTPSTSKSAIPSPSVASSATTKMNTPEKVSERTETGTPEKLTTKEADYNARIAAGESGGKYDTIFGKAGGAMINGKPVTQNTIGEVVAWQETMRSSNRQAAGKYQFMNVARAAKLAGLSNNDLFDGPNQERMMTAYTQKNAESLRQLGLEATPENLSMSHAVGPEGTKKLLDAQKAGRGSDNAAELLFRNIQDPNRRQAAFKTNPQLNTSIDNTIARLSKKVRGSAVPPQQSIDYNPNSSSIGYTSKLSELDSLQQQLKVAQSIIMVIKETNNISTGVNFV